MDELDIYDDLDDFHEQEEKKSKELLALEAKYEETLKTIDAMKMEKKDLKKKVRIMEHNLQSLLDTAKAEIKRKDKLIEELRKEKDDLCFRRNRTQQKPNQFLRRSDALQVINEEIPLNKVYNLPAKSTNPFQQDIPHFTNEKYSANEEKSLSSSTRNFEEFADRKNNVKHCYPNRELRANIVVNGSETKITFDEKCSLAASQQQDLTISSKDERIKNSHRNESDSKGIQCLKEHDRYKEKPDGISEPIERNFQSRNRDSDINGLKNRGKYLNERSCSSRNEDTMQSDRRKNDKDSFDKFYDGHSAYRKNKHERKYRSRSSDRHHTSHRSRSNKVDLQKSSKEHEKEESPSQHVDNKKNNKHKKLHYREDKLSSSENNSKECKRRRSSHSDEDRHGKRRRSLREDTAKKPLDEKRLPKRIPFDLEDIEISDDRKCDISKNIDFEKGKIKLKNTPHIEESIENNKLVKENCRNKGTCQLEKDIKGASECRVDLNKAELCTQVAFENSSKSSAVADSLEQKPIEKYELNVLEPSLHVADEVKPKSVDKVETETQVKIGNSVQLKLSDVNIFDEAQPKPTVKPGKTIFVDDNLRCKFMTVKESEDVNIKDETYPEQKIESQMNFKYIKNSSVNTSQHNTLDDCKYSSERKTIQEEFSMKPDDNLCEEVVALTKSRVEILSLSSNKTTEKTEVTSNGKYVKKFNTPRKFAMFDALFGSTTSNMNTSSGTLLENVHGVLCNSNNSSRTTSPDLYTDVSETSSRNSPKPLKTFSNKMDQMESIIAEKSIIATSPTKKVVPLHYVEVLHPSLCNLKEQYHNNKGKENESNSVSERKIVKPFYNTIVEPECHVVENKFLMYGNEVNRDVVMKTDKSDKMENVEQLPSNLFTKTEMSKESLSKDQANNLCFDLSNASEISSITETTDSVENSRLKEVKNILKPKECDINIDESKSLEKYPEHDLQAICLVDVSDDEVTNIVPTVPLKLAETELCQASKMTKHENEVQKSYHSDSNLFDHEILKKINEECVRLKLASKEQLNIKSDEEPTKCNEETLNEATIFGLKKIEKSAQVLDGEIKTVSLSERNSSKIEELVVNSNETGPSTSELHNEEEHTSFNLTLSSDEEDETLANLRKKYKLQQKEKIEILENIRLPTLFQPGIQNEIHESPKKNISMNLIDMKVNGIDMAAHATKDEIFDSTSKKILFKAKSESIAALENKPFTILTDQKDKSSDSLQVLKTGSGGKIRTHAEELIVNAIQTNNNAEKKFCGEDEVTSISTKTMVSKTESDMHMDATESFDNDTNALLNKFETKDHIIFKSNEFNEKLLIQKEKRLGKLSVGNSKDRQGLTERNGKVLQNNEKHYAQDSLNEILSENVQERASFSNTVSKSSKKQNTNEKLFLQKKLRICIPRLLKKSPIKTRTNVHVKNSRKECSTRTLKTPTKRKRSKSPTSSDSSFNLLDDTTTQLEPKSPEINTSAEVRAMLIDGKSPEITNASIVSSPINVMYDTNLDDIDKNMQAIFQSPAKFDLTLPPIDAKPCGNSTVLNVTIDETVNVETISATVTSSTTPTPSTPSTPPTPENIHKANESSFESKLLQLGTTQYLYERVSENVVNLFITRRRKKKRAKLDNNNSI